ncbi:hypothetical protein GCM10023229_21760 [Flavisolibacter ginsenosidimutans]
MQPVRAFKNHIHMIRFTCLTLSFILCFSGTVRNEKKDANAAKKKITVVWQPSHQTDTGVDFSEAETCNGIATAAMKLTVPSGKVKLKEYKVWSLGRTDVHHADSGSNTKIAHTAAVVDGKISGYAYELKEADEKHPEVFIAVHNNGGTRRHAVWGYVHYGDTYEPVNRDLAARLVKAICTATGMEDRGVLVDSTTGRNDYRCASTGKLSFYSLDENVNTAPYRVLLEIGDNAASHEFLKNSANQKIIGEAIKKELVKWLEER